MKRLVLSVALAIALSSSTNAQEVKCETAGCKLADTIFGSIEDNTNKMIDLGEFVQFGNSIFVSMDTDGSSSISFDEFAAWDPGFDIIAQNADKTSEYQTAQRILFAFWDRDGDQKIATREYRIAMTTDFARADADNDALLSRKEFLLGYIVNISYRAAIQGS